MRLSVTKVGFVTTLATVALLTSVSLASAFNLRNPQVGIGGSSLQSYLNSVGESINVTTDQMDAQVWQSDVSGNSLFTLMLELAGYANQNAIGVYNANQPVPTLYQVFPPNAAPGWAAMAAFHANGDLVVNLFDQNSAFVGATTYSGVNRNAFGFYLQGPAGTFYSEDGRNGGNAQAVTFAGTGQNWGTWWMAWEDLAISNGDYDDAVLLLESVVPVGTQPATMGQIKARYR